MLTRLGFATSLALALLTVSVFGQGQTAGKSPYEWSAVDKSGKQFTYRQFPQPVPLWTKDVTKAVKPEYPYEERKRKHTGIGMFRLEIDVETGKVRRVTVIKSTKYNRLDEAAKNALVGWRFRPNTWKELSLPVDFALPPPVGLRSRSAH
ncbi:MAG TPA: TonB family protein [Chthoniobacterales bacterium]|nr:TonB family protein [Chthoniobacterales bacterium]